MFNTTHSFNSGIDGASSGGDLGYNGFSVTLNYFTALPDPNILHDPNITIMFKSLVKKDSITKEKSLNDLIQFLDDNLNNANLIDELLILSWIQLYAKLAIDNSRSVRILSHQVQAKLLTIMGGKSFSKYLKSSIPIWLQGIYDNDKVVSSATYNTLLHCFQESKERVDTKIWITFFEQIVNYISTVITLENHESLSDQRYTKEDDSFAKYERVLNGCLMMLTKIISLINSGEIVISEESNELKQIEELLNLENLWDYLGSSITTKTLNLSLFKSLLVLLKALFGNVSNDVSHEPTIIFKALTNVKALYKLISKKFIKNVKLKSSGSNNDIVYSNIIIQFWDTLISLTGFSLLSSEYKKAWNIKKNFWELAGSKSRSRLIEYLKLGSCSSNPIYYSVVAQFFQTLSSVNSPGFDDDGFINFESITDARLVINDMLLSQFNVVKIKEYKERSLACTLKVYQIFRSGLNENELLPLLNAILYHLLDTVYPINSINHVKDKKCTLLIQFGNFLNTTSSGDTTKCLLGELNNQISGLSLSNEKELDVKDFKFNIPVLDVITNYIYLLTYLAENSTSAMNMIETIIYNICDGTENQALESEPTIAFHIIALFLKNSSVLSVNQRSKINDFMQEVPTFIEPQFIESPIQLLSSFLESESKMIEEIDLKELLNNFYLKVSMIDENKIAILLSTMTKSKSLEILNNKAEFSDMYNYLLKLSEKEQMTEKETSIIFSCTSDSTIFSNLVATYSKSDDARSNFIYNFLKYSNSGISAGFENPENSSGFTKILSVCWKNIEDPQNQEFLSIIAGNISHILLADSIYHYLRDSTIETDFSSIAKYLLKISETSGSIFTFLPYERIFETILDAVEHIDNDILSIANPMEQNIYLVKKKPGLSLSLEPSLIIIGKFLAEVAGNLDSKNGIDIKIELLIICGIISEYIHDYLFLENENKRSTSLDDQILSIRSKLLNIFKDHIRGATLQKLLPIINNNEASGQEDICISMFSRLNRELIRNTDYNNFQFYTARLLKIYLDSFMESETLQSFESTIDINFNKLLSCPLKLSVVLSSCSKFFVKSTKFDRIRNYVAAEILGIKSDTQILNEGLNLLTLCINFFNVDINENDKYDVIPSHRLTMIINQLSKWLESDISYDESFIPIRCQLAKFFIGLIDCQKESLPDKFWELAIHLCLDNLGIAQIEAKHFELEYLTLKLFIALNKPNGLQNENWKEDRDSLHEQILDLLVIDANHTEDFKQNNQPVLLCHDLLNRICNGYQFKFNILNDKLNGLYSLLTQSKFVGLQRIATSLLHEVILKNQQEFVVEYQLQKSHLNSSDDLDDTKSEMNAQLPTHLMESIHILDDGLDDIDDSESLESVSGALWSWYLIFDHFKDITYSIRSEYVSQLKSGKSIDKLLNFIFEQVDVTNNNGILKKLTTAEVGNKKVKPTESLIQDYDVSTGIPGESIKFEMKFLLIHLYYLSFQYLGSYVQSWFNGIRDRQLKQKVEKFSVKYVSPLIVLTILEDISKSKDKLTNKDENMSIKVSGAANEIKSVYLIDDQTMEMVIKIPESYPLSNVVVDGPLRLGVKENQWKAWLLASQRIISLTNGSIFESIELFNRNVNLHFSGFEDCAICYSILHQDHSLPSKTCPTCSNKFHAACLYKWFKSSGASTCPLCRSAFNFRTSRSAAV